MRVTVLGAGPAGLYLAALLKKADPGHEVTVLERNAPGSTFGWGVVFSEETMGALRDADYPSYLRITDTFARWDAIDIRYRGHSLRSRGHAFSAIARKQLLRILQERCTELGVRLRFETEITDPSAVDGDLVVAADGVRSLLREAGTESFGTSIRPQGCKYVWFGTDLVLDAFRFIFAETEHGLFQVHAYPFDEATSTFIVECPEDTWRRAGLDTATEQQSIAFCEKVFAADLDGHRLMSNRSTWQSFPRVSNRSWHRRSGHGHVVLVGDAAHTAHFTIGSGTKLAMEDAIALANAFVRHSDTEAALTEYELERQPVVERFQQASEQSAGYFERVGDHTGMAPVQFAFNLLTRSGRISHGSLAVRDPDFVRVLDSWFAGRTSVAPPPMFAPVTIGPASLPNRIVTEGGTPFAGAGLVLTGFVAVTDDGRTWPGCPTACADLKSTADSVHETGALAGVLLGHAGARGATGDPARGPDVPLPDGQGWPLLAASAVRYGALRPTPSEASQPDLVRIRDAFGAAARRADEQGFDVLELDVSDGRLLAGFLSPLTNRRDDEYAQPLRYPLEVLDAVRAQWPADRLLAVRLTVADWARRGATVSDGIAAARAFAEHGAGLIHVRAGQTVAEGRPEYRRGFLTELSDRVRNAVGVPTLVGGYLTTADEVNTVLGAGRADLCVLRVRRTPLDEQVAL